MLFQSSICYSPIKTSWTWVRLWFRQEAFAIIIWYFLVLGPIPGMSKSSDVQLDIRVYLFGTISAACIALIDFFWGNVYHGNLSEPARDIIKAAKAGDKIAERVRKSEKGKDVFLRAPQLSTLLDTSFAGVVVAYIVACACKALQFKELTELEAGTKGTAIAVHIAYGSLTFASVLVPILTYGFLRKLFRDSEAKELSTAIVKGEPHSRRAGLWCLANLVVSLRIVTLAASWFLGYLVVGPLDVSGIVQR